MSRKPDLENDRILIDMGATLPMQEKGRLATENRAHWTAAVGRLINLDMPPGMWIREAQYRIRHQLVCGTIDELTEDYRQGLIRCINVYTESEWGQDSLGRFQDYLKERGVNGLVKGVDPRICASDDEPAVAAQRAKRLEQHAQHGAKGLTMDQQDLVEDLLLSLDNSITARELAGMLLAYSEFRNPAPEPDQPIVVEKK